MLVYKYSDVGEYLNPVLCQLNTARPGEYLTPPPNTIAAKPPEAGENQAVVINATLDGWEKVADYRGYQYWMPDGSHHRIDQIGIEPPADALNEPPPPSQEELDQQAYEQWKVERQAAVDKITVEIDGLIFDGDEVSQGRMFRRAARASSPEELCRWQLADNSVVAVTAATLDRAASEANRVQDEIWIRQKI